MENKLINIKTKPVYDELVEQLKAFLFKHFNRDNIHNLDMVTITISGTYFGPDIKNNEDLRSDLEQLLSMINTENHIKQLKLAIYDQYNIPSKLDPTKNTCICIYDGHIAIIKRIDVLKHNFDIQTNHIGFADKYTISREDIPYLVVIATD